MRGAERPKWILVSDTQYVGFGGKVQWTRDKAEADKWAEILGGNWRVVEASEYLKQFAEGNS